MSHSACILSCKICFLKKKLWVPGAFGIYSPPFDLDKAESEWSHTNFTTGPRLKVWKSNLFVSKLLWEMEHIKHQAESHCIILPISKAVFFNKQSNFKQRHCFCIMTIGGIHLKYILSTRDYPKASLRDVPSAQAIFQSISRLET